MIRSASPAALFDLALGAVLLLAGNGAALAQAPAAPAPAPYRSPMALAFSPDGARLAVSDHTARCVVIIDVAAAKAAAQIPVEGKPVGVAWAPDGSRIYAAVQSPPFVAEIDPSKAAVARKLKAGPRPAGLALVPSKGLLLVANSAGSDVSVLDLASGAEKARIPVEREPYAIALCPERNLAIVGNSLPGGRASDPGQASALSLIDLEKLARLGDLRLPPGSGNIRDIATSADGRWAYAVHTVGRTQMPTTQLDRGWVNTNGLTIVDLAARQILATILLDHPMEGSANPWGLARSKDGKALWVSISGNRSLGRIDLARLHEFLDGKLPADHPFAQAANYSPGTENIWLRIQRDLGQRAELVNDLAALDGPGLIRRVNLDANGPRGIDLSPDGSLLAAAAYFSGKVVLLDASSLRPKAAIPLGPSPEPDAVRRGEIAFHDANHCFQKWLSCATCHPWDARADGFNWDLLNDGLGNPKNSHSLLLGHRTPPAMSHGVRATVEDAVRAGFIHILFRQPEEAILADVNAYLKSLEPEPSPHLLEGGALSEAARRGKALFESPRTECSTCHPAPLFTDLKTYDVGTRGEFDRNQSEFDNPTLIEIFRTAPYLHDGSAATLKEVLVEKNKGDRHGKTSGLSPQEIEDLVAYLQSL